jgi:hypothetical protein
MNGTWLLLPIIIGLSTLSTAMPTATAHMTMKTAQVSSPFCMSQRAPGTTTSSVPPGMIERKKVASPSSAGEGRPAIQ